MNQQQQQQQQQHHEGSLIDADSDVAMDQHQPTQPQQPDFQDQADDSMELTQEERQLALSIKNAVESSDHIKPIPDFEYAYLAISCRSKTLEQILDVAYKLQCFWELYKLNGTPQEGMALVKDLMELQPGHILDVSYLPTEQCYSLSVDMANLRPEKVKTDAQWKIFMAGLYYIFRAMTTDFQSIRNGITILAECEGMGIQNFDYTLQVRMVTELLSYFPMIHRDHIWLNAPTAANMIIAIGKRAAKKEFFDTLQMGGAIEGYDGRLDTLFNMPTPEIAQQNLLSRIDICLWQRCHNEHAFSLT